MYRGREERSGKTAQFDLWSVKKEGYMNIRINMNEGEGKNLSAV